MTAGVGCETPCNTLAMAHTVTSIAIRPESPDDGDAIRHLVAAAFGRDGEAELVERIRASPEYVPEMALVAEVGGEVVGHVMVSHAVIRNDGGDRRISMLSPLAVHPEHQRSGIGSALVRASLSVADSLGEPLVVLEGDPAYYGRLGFEHVDRLRHRDPPAGLGTTRGGPGRAAVIVRPRRSGAPGDGRLPGGVRRFGVGDPPGWCA